MVASWMLDVIHEENNQNKREPNVFSLAICLLDRFMTTSPGSITKDQLQLLGAACLLISSKLNESESGGLEESQIPHNQSL